MPTATRSVTVINPIVRDISGSLQSLPKRKRVAAYARVSTDEQEQLTSYEAQVDYYTRHIQANSEWTFIATYADEGLSGTSIKKRDGFNLMISDALSGKIDLILTKSVSRFARNTVDTLTTVRKLKEKGVEVYFEKENIYTMDSKGELLITIMSSLAQEESRSISENVTWGQRKRFSDGKVSLPYKQFIGYEKGPDGMPKIVPEQAETVKLIYRLFLEGLMPSTIACELTKRGILTPSGKIHWPASTVESILTNEKYKGDALLQKCFTVDFLTKKQKANEGEVPQYYVENSHPAIIRPEVWGEVQSELERRKAVKYSSRGGCFSSRIVCGECGSFYGPKVWHSTDQYRRTIWRCNHKYGNGVPCSTPHLDEETIKAAFTAAFNSLITYKDEVITEYRVIIQQLADTTGLDTESTDLQSECEVVAGLMQKAIAENAHSPLDQDDYIRRYSDLAARYEAAKKKLDENEALRFELKVHFEKLTEFIDRLEKCDGMLTQFDEELWNATVESLTVKSATEITICLKGGAKLEWTI